MGKGNVAQAMIARGLLAVIPGFQVRRTCLSARGDLQTLSKTDNHPIYPSQPQAAGRSIERSPMQAHPSQTRFYLRL